MPEYLHVEKPFLDQPGFLDWAGIGNSMLDLLTGRVPVNIASEPKQVSNAAL